MGYDVTIIEKRTIYSRLNVIKTWPVTVDDLMGLGLKVFLPTIKKHGLHHVGTKDMQMVMTKVALLLGAKFIIGESVIGVIEEDK